MREIMTSGKMILDKVINVDVSDEHKLLRYFGRVFFIIKVNF